MLSGRGPEHGPLPLRRIANARVGDRLVDLALRDGVVAAVTPAGDGHAGGGPGGGGFDGAVLGGDGAVLDAGGALVCAGFVDAHVHLDKAFLGPAAPGGAGDPSATDLAAAIRAVDARRPHLDAAAIEANGRRALDRLRRHGVVAARAHVEVAPTAGLDLLGFQLELAAAGPEHGLALQLVAFPQLGLEPLGARRLLAGAMAAGCHVVGGCPYMDADPAGHLDAVFALAERHGCDVDLHLDFTDDAGASQLALVVERTAAHAMGGHVTVGHCTTLAAMDPTRQRAALDALAAAGIALVVMPATDLFLGGHGEPGRRSLAPVERAIEAGVRTAITNNNLANPFAPLGNGNLLQAAWLAAVTRRLADPARRAGLLDAITTAPAAILGRPRHGPEVGASADLVVLDARGPDADDEPVGAAPAVSATVQAGRLTYRTVSPVLR